VFEARHSERWIISVIMALGHAAGQQVTAGRMTPDEAGAAYREASCGSCSSIDGRRGLTRIGANL
jgi:hypothetical protein